VQRASVVSQPSEARLGSIDLSVDQPTAQRLSVLGAQHAARVHGPPYPESSRARRDGVVIRSVYPSAPVRTMSYSHRRPTMSTTEMQWAPALIKLPPAERSTYGTVTPKDGNGLETWTATTGCGTPRAVRHWDRAGARDQKPAAGSHQAADGASVRRRASSGEAERPGGGGRFLTATLDAWVWSSRRALRGRAGAAWMYWWSCIGDLLGSKRRSRPSKMSDRSASLRRCFTTASGRKSFPRSAGSPGSAETRTALGPIQSCSPGPPASHPASANPAGRHLPAEVKEPQATATGLLGCFGLVTLPRFGVGAPGHRVLAWRKARTWTEGT
jgi:hypothetical protein